VTLGPAPVLAIFLAVVHVGLFVLLRGSAGGRLPLLFVAAWLGAWAGDAIAGRLGFDLLRVGDFRLVAASAFAWVGIGFVTIVSTLGPERPKVGS
jgi:hypothetical protein